MEVCSGEFKERADRPVETGYGSMSSTSESRTRSEFRAGRAEAQGAGRCRHGLAEVTFKYWSIQYMYMR